MEWRIFIALPLLMVATAHSQELLLLAGGMQQSGTGEDSHAWAIEYRHPVRENLTASFSWLNEGHLPGHHRDGHALQIWGRTNTSDRRFSLAAGMGPYHYFDTIVAPSGRYADDHGWGVVGSLAATYYTNSRWLYQLRFNRIVARDGIDTNALMLGIGYQLEPVSERGPQETAPRQWNMTTDNEVTASLGVAIVNSLRSQHATAGSMEYRHGLARHVDATVTLLNEGDAGVLRRRGLSAQLWGVREVLASDRLVLGVGLGPYLANDKYRDRPGNGDQWKTSWIFSAMAAYRIGGQWNVRMSWNRVGTDYNRDTDVILLGLGYRY